MLIFLDFDGVLHPFFPLPDNSDKDNAHFCGVPRLAQVLVKHPTAQVVISSTWRLGRSLDQLRALLGPVVGARVVGVTPKGSFSHGPGGRLEEIQMYLSQTSDPNQPWVALDDVDTLFDAKSPLIVCPDQFGPAQAAQLDDVLSNPHKPVQRHPFVLNMSKGGLVLPKI